MQVRRFKNVPEDWKLIHYICHNCNSKVLKRTYGYLQRILFFSPTTFFCDFFDETAFFAGTKAKTHAHCIAIAVAEEYQRQGLGRQIVYYEMDELRYIGLDTLTLRSNKAENGLFFWLKMGAKILGEVKGDWKLQLKF